jgi:hypothetical protein
MLSVNYYCGDRGGFKAFCNELIDSRINRDYVVQFLTKLGNDYES